MARLRPRRRRSPGIAVAIAALLVAGAAPAAAIGVDVAPLSGLSTSESGGTATFTVVLASPPAADVIIPVATSDPSEGTVNVSSLTFTAADWDVPQTVTVTGVDDAVQDGDKPYNVLLGAATSDDVDYSGYDPADVAVTNTDNDAVGIQVTPTSGLVTSEAGGTATFDVVLNSQPTADVTLPVGSSDAGEGTPSASSLKFTAADWNVPQTVTVHGVDDAVDDGDQGYTITLGAATSSDPNYDGVDATDVSVTNTDDDVAGVQVTPTSGLVTTESGGTASFTIVLRSQPTANVTIPVASSDATEGSVSASSVTFTSANWNVPQSITVTGADDFVADGDIAYSVTLGKATSSDALYAAIDPADVAVTNTDNDVAGIQVTPTSGLVTTEAGGQATFTVVLNSQPLANVSIPVSSSDVSEGTVSTSNLTFTAANWNVPQTVTVTGVDDAVQDGNVAYSIVLGLAVSVDVRYTGMNPADAGASNTDNDAAGIAVTPTSGLFTTEAGGTATFNVVLQSQPTANVVIPVASTDVTEGTVSASSLTFTPANWNTPRTITVT
ncbi:MAG TPA: Calx-beta domain-containing protein, partial [Verrucomicrobiae bacterium]|nr:Calx-beta domain-containing protein [Verrucomicrobiae bacterium]